MERYSACQDLILAFANAPDCLSVDGSIKHDPASLSLRSIVHDLKYVNEVIRSFAVQGFEHASELESLWHLAHAPRVRESKSRMHAALVPENKKRRTRVNERVRWVVTESGLSRD
jgi:hypothetical protein